MATSLKSLFNKIGIDGAIAFTILTRVIQGGGGIISIVFIARYLSSSEQGYYYTFASILAIQIFFELGLSGIITQYTAYEFAHLKWDDRHQLDGDEIYKSRLSSLLRFCVKWFGILSVILFIVLIIAGFVFFSKYNKGLNIDWKGPWIILCSTTALNLFIDPILAFFDGLGNVKDMSKVRLLQKTANITLLFIFFACGFKLYSAALASLIAIIINYIQIVFSTRIRLLKTIWKEKTNWVINYYKEIFPFQWRIAVSWISGYFIFQLFNPILFATEGAVVAGQMGMTIAALTGINSISMSWITTKVPMLSSLISKKDYKTLDLNFRKIFIQSMGINVFIIAVFVFGILIAWACDLGIANRFLAMAPLIYMCLSSAINSIVFSLATYLRCHKKEPMLLQSVAMGALVCLSTVILGNKFGVMGITSGYFTLVAFIGFPWTVYIFLNKRKAWHHE